jgi:putative effector of murein hydrolase
MDFICLPGTAIVGVAASIHEYEAMGLTFVISTGLRASVLGLNLATLLERSLVMKEVSVCDDSVALGGRKGFARRVGPAGTFCNVDIV